MPRSTRDSDDEPGTKAALKKRSPTFTSAAVDSPVRRSLRVLKANKQNDTSPESVASDVSSVQNRTTRRRVGTMDSSTTEGYRSLRSRKNSVSSEASELAELESTVSTPTKRVTRRSGVALSSVDTPTKRPRRFTRAGSETKTSPPARTTRKTRATSVEPESIKELRNLHSELPNTPTKRRSRASRMPSESPVMEEVERKGHMEDTVIEVDEIDDIETSGETSKQSQAQSEKFDKSTDEIITENRSKSGNESVKGSLNISSEKSSSGIDEGIINDVTIDTKLIETHNKSSLNKDGSSSTDISLLEIESLTYTSDTSSKNESESKTESSLKSSTKKEELNTSDKENQSANIINEMIQANKEIIASTVTLTSPKPFVSDSPYKITKDKERLSTSKSTDKISAIEMDTSTLDKTSAMEVDTLKIDNKKSESINLSEKSKSESISAPSTVTENHMSINDNKLEEQAVVVLEKITVETENVQEKMDVDEPKEIVLDEVDIEEIVPEKMNIEKFAEKKIEKEIAEKKIEEKVTDQKSDEKIVNKQSDSEETQKEKISENSAEKMDIDEEQEAASFHEKMDVDDENLLKNIDTDAANSSVEITEIVEEKESSKNTSEVLNQENNQTQEIIKQLDAELSKEILEDTIMEDQSMSSNQTDERKTETSTSSEKVLFEKEDKNKSLDKKMESNESSSSIEIISEKQDKKELSSSIETACEDENVCPMKDNADHVSEAVEENNTIQDGRESVSSIETVVLTTIEDFPKNTNENANESNDNVFESSKTKEEVQLEKTAPNEETAQNASESKNSNISIDMIDLCDDKNESDLCSAIKSAQSSIVTETDVETTEDVLGGNEKEEKEDEKKENEEKEEKSQETSTTLNKSATKKDKDIESVKNAENIENTENIKNKPEDIENTKNVPIEKEEISSPVKNSKLQKNETENTSESDINIADLFQDISADEWKKKAFKKKVKSGNDSDRSVPVEREAECDLVLVDREAWLAAEKLKAEKEKEVFDYDSDDTVVIKSRLDSMIESDDENMNLSIIKEESKLDLNLEDSEDDNVKKSSSKSEKKLGSAKKSISNKSLTKNSDSPLNKSNKLNLSQKSKKASKELEKSKETSDDVEIEEEMQPSRNETENPEKIDLSTSIERRKRIMEGIMKEAAADTCEVTSDLETATEKEESGKQNEEEDGKMEEDSTSPVVKTPAKRESLNTSKTPARKTPGNDSIKSTSAKSNVSKKSINENEEDSDESTAKQNMSVLSQKSSSKKKLLSKRRRIESNEMEVNSSDSMNESIITIKRRSLNVSGKKGSTKENKQDANMSILLQEDEDESEELSSDNEELQTSKSLKSKKKKTKKKDDKNYSTLVHIDSDMDVQKLCSDSSDSWGDSVRIPKFLYVDDETSSDEDKEKGESSEEKSEASMDSDIEKEYNLQGKNISKYSDDNVPGDECRASESEYSDPDDNGSDLADFVVDDDEVEEGDEEEEEEDENEEEEAEEEIEVEEEEPEIESEKEAKKAEVETDRMSVDEEGSIDAKFSSEVETEEEETMKEKKIKEKSEKHEEELSSKLSEVTLDQKKSKKSMEQQSSSMQERSKTQRETNSVKNVSFESSLVKGKLATNKRQQDFEKRLNDSDFVFMQKIHKLQGSIECSTPKAVMRTAAKIPAAVSSLASENKNKIETETPTEQTEISSAKKRLAKESLKLDKSTKESSLKNERTLMSKSLPLTSPKSFKENLNEKPKVTQLHQTVIVTENDATIQYLRKTKLNESAPTLTLKENSSKSRRKSAEEKSEDTTEIIGDENLEKELKTAATLDTEKKRKKPKMAKEESEQDIEDKENDNITEEVSERIQHSTKTEKRLSAKPEDTEISSEKKKKKKEKKKVQIQSTEPQEPSFKDDIPKQVEVLDKETKKASKKKRKAKLERIVEPEICEDDLPKKKKKNKQQNMQEEEEVIMETSAETKKEKKKKKLNTLNADQQKQEQSLPAKKLKKQKQQEIVDASDSDESPQVVAFSKARMEALEAIKRAADSIKAGKELKKKKQREHIQRMQEEKEAKDWNIRKAKQKKTVEINPVATSKMNLKRLPTEVLEKLYDGPIRSRKKQKVQKDDELRPSRNMFTSEDIEMENLDVEECYSPVSSYGGTTDFDVISLKANKQTSRKQAVASFRQRMLARNSRHTVSSYLMYLQKQKVLGKN